MNDAVLRTIQVEPGRSTRAIVDLDAIAENVRAMTLHVGQERGIRAVVKADGYGHGAVPVGEVALEAGAFGLAVATVGELAQLRRHFIVAPILVLGPIDESELERAVLLDAELTLGDLAFVRSAGLVAAGLGKTIRVHAKVDTGMHRFGIAPANLAELIRTIDAEPNLDLVGVEMHHAMSDDPGSAVARVQADLFDELCRELGLYERPGLNLHHANSGAGLTKLAPQVGSVRLGIALYGLKPGPDEDLLPGMRPAMSVLSRVSRLHSLQPGDGVSYGHTYVAPAVERVGLIPIGYADGYRRALSNRGWMNAGQARNPVRGRVCMDQTVIGSLRDEVALGDWVGVAGPIGGGPSFDELASTVGTINYEIATGWSTRIPRYFVKGGRIVSTQIEGHLTTR